MPHPRTPLSLLNEVRIVAPCPARWEDMRGDDRVRFCGQCGLNVYNVSALTAAEAIALIERQEGRLCMQLYRRPDGTVLTADCPAGVLERVRWRAAAVVCSLLVLLPASIVGMLGFTPELLQRPAVPSADQAPAPTQLLPPAGMVMSRPEWEALKRGQAADAATQSPCPK